VHADILMATKKSHMILYAIKFSFLLTKHPFHIFCLQKLHDEIPRITLLPQMTAYKISNIWQFVTLSKM